MKSSNEVDNTDINKDDCIHEIKQDYMNAITKNDFDNILKKYNIKMLKNNKKVSPLRVKLDIKKAIIRMAFYEYNDTFDYDAFTKI
tara:strand:- start:335 stop:592 length:258 start_codon:yes stop_codon:yes gene_type:complete